MRRIPFLVIILLAFLGAGTAAWWLSSADERRVSECREAGVEDQDRLARCAESAEASKAVLEEVKDERRAEFRRVVRQRIQTHLAELRAGARSEVDKSQYERISIESLVDTYNLKHFWIGPSEVPAGVENRRFAIKGRLQTADLEKEGASELRLRPLPPGEVKSAALEGLMFSLFGIEADIGDLERNEREFAWKVCGSTYVQLTLGCPVVAYGRLVFKSPSTFFDRDTLGLVTPVFRVEAVEFLDPPQP